MSRLFLAAFVALSLSVTALAKEFTLTGCTTDKQSVSLAVDVNEDLAAKHPVVLHLSQSFSAAAASLTAANLLSEVGFAAFIGGIDDQDFKAINAISGPPVVTGSCK